MFAVHADVHLFNVRFLLLLVIILSMLGCTPATVTTLQTPTNATAIPTSAATVTPFMLEISPIEASSDHPNIDTENQRLIDLAFANLTGMGSFAFDLNMMLVIDSPTNHIEVVLRGDGAFTGFDSPDTNVSVEANLHGSAAANGDENTFSAQFRLVDGVSYLQVGASNGVNSSETPWAYLTTDDIYNSVFAGTVLDDTLTAEPSAELALPPLEDFFGLINLTDFITSQRLADETGGVAHFIREVDLIAYLSSGQIVDVVTLIEELSPDSVTGMNETELEESFAQLGEILPTLFPVFRTRFHQFVNPDLTMNRLTFDIDINMDEAAFSSLTGQAVSPSAQALTEIQLDLLIGFSNHGGDFIITAPEDAIPLAELQVEPLSESGS